MQSGYDVSIVFVFLRSADACVARILERVRSEIRMRRCEPSDELFLEIVAEERAAS